VTAIVKSNQMPVMDGAGDASDVRPSKVGVRQYCIA